MSVTKKHRAPLTAVIYLRVSSSGQVNKGSDPEGYSIPAQRQVCRDYATQLKADVVREYVEPGHTGTNVNRPAMQRLLGDLDELKPDYVIFYDLSRICRNDFDAQWLWREITDKHGALIQSTRERVDSSPSGRLTYSIMAAVNAMRSRDDAEKVKMGLRRKHATGGTNGKAPIGYLNVRRRELGRDIRVVEIDPERAPLVRMAFECYASGQYSLTAITELLDAAGLRTPMTAKRPAKALGRSAVYRILRDDYYIGTVTYEGVKNPDGNHPPLIDQARFERVQEILRAHALSGERSQKHEQYLKGTVFCGNCGSRLLFSPVTGNGGRYEYFSCQGRRRPGIACRARHLRVDEVEAAVERYYLEHVGLTAVDQQSVRKAVTEYAERKQAIAQREGQRATRRIEALKKEQQRLIQLSYRDLVDDDVLAAEQERIKGERAQAEKWATAATRDTQQILEALDTALRLLDKPGEAYLRASPVTRRMFNQAIFEKLLVDDGDVTEAANTPWVDGMGDLARALRNESERRETAGVEAAAPIRKRSRARNDHDPQHGGRGLNFDRLVPPQGLEP